ncbi:S66 family peptidase [Janibacter sp. G56]|uniref:S66 family peptidase n=1 Tax=Janibacter sp. G56 TaxID=3418717 RepID=UPI003D044E14
MPLTFPEPLRPGDTIGVTAPSSGVEDDLRPRLDHAVAVLRDRGFEVVLGECLGTPSHVSAPRRARADELMSLLVDPDVVAVVPPWGGETATDLLTLLDFDVLAACDPSWLVGFSDLSTLMLPITLRSGWATLHGWNLMDTPYEPAPGLLHWLDVAMAEPGATLTQRAATHCRSSGWDDYRADPTVSRMSLTDPTRWSVLGQDGPAGHDPVDVSGRLIGGCLDTLTHLAGTPYGDVRAFGMEHAQEGLIVYLEAASANPFEVDRILHGMTYAGWFDHANAVVIGRTPVPDAPGFTHHEAVADALGELGIPVVLDGDFGHQQPCSAFVNGALARLVVDGDRQEITQTLP